MGSIEPTEAQMKGLFENVAANDRVVMINLLRYRERANYPADSDAEQCSGREAYQRYGAAVAPMIGKFGGRPIFIGPVTSTVIAPDGEQWDDAVLVEYPTRDAFIQMTSSDEYQAIVVHRTAALADSRLIATSGRVL